MKRLLPIILTATLFVSYSSTEEANLDKVVWANSDGTQVTFYPDAPITVNKDRLLRFIPDNPDIRLAHVLLIFDQDDNLIGRLYLRVNLDGIKGALKKAEG